MRKICLTLIAIVLVGTACAQVSIENHRGRTPSPAVTKVKPGTVQASTAQKMVLWSSDFTDLNDWTIGNSAGNSVNWVIADAPTYWWSANSALVSSSGGNAAAFNSDEFATADNQVENNAWIQSAPINCSSNNGIEVTFHQFYSKWTSKTIVEVSNNGGQTWTDYEVNQSMMGNEQTSNPNLVSVNISPTAGNEQSVLIRLLFLSNDISDGGSDNLSGVAWDYGWIIDDFEVNTLPNNDIALLEAWHANLSVGYEYSMVPLEQVREMIPVLVVENQGSMNQNIDIECTISGALGVVSTTLINHTSSFGSTDTIYFYSGFTPSSIDEYEVRFSIPADFDTSNDSIKALSLTVSDFVMGHDYGPEAIYGWDPSSTDPNIVALANARHSWGNIYRPQLAQSLYSVGVDFAIGTSEWLNVKIRLQEIPQGGTLQSPLVLLNEVDYVVAPSEIGLGITNISFATPTMLLGGRTYVIDVVKTDTVYSNQALLIYGSDLGTEDHDFSTVSFGQYDTDPNPHYYTNWGFAPIIRANFIADLSLEETILSEIEVFPNPTSGIVTISGGDENKKTIQVIDLMGQEVHTSSMISQKTIDLSILKAGVYLIKISDQVNSTVQRIIIQ